jgi:hypothetical protein
MVGVRFYGVASSTALISIPIFKAIELILGWCTYRADSVTPNGTVIVFTVTGPATMSNCWRLRRSWYY